MKVLYMSTRLTCKIGFIVNLKKYFTNEKALLLLF